MSAYWSSSSATPPGQVEPVRGDPRPRIPEQLPKARAFEQHAVSAWRTYEPLPERDRPVEVDDCDSDVMDTLERRGVPERERTVPADRLECIRQPFLDVVDT